MGINKENLLTLKRGLVESATFTLNTPADLSVKEAILSLQRFEIAYNRICRFNVKLVRVLEEYDFADSDELTASPLDYRRLITSSVSDRGIPQHARLGIHRVSINSPGIWEFIGKLSPLQTLLDYLQQRHERKKDNEYRNELEKEKMQLENEARRIENKKAILDIAAKEISLMRELGIPEEQISKIITQNYQRPLSKISTSEIMFELPEKSDLKLIQGNKKLKELS